MTTQTNKENRRQDTRLEFRLTKKEKTFYKKLVEVLGFNKDVEMFRHLLVSFQVLKEVYDIDPRDFADKLREHRLERGLSEAVPKSREKIDENKQLLVRQKGWIDNNINQIASRINDTKEAKASVKLELTMKLNKASEALEAIAWHYLNKKAPRVVPDEMITGIGYVGDSINAVARTMNKDAKAGELKDLAGPLYALTQPLDTLVDIAETTTNNKGGDGDDS